MFSFRSLQTNHIEAMELRNSHLLEEIQVEKSNIEYVCSNYRAKPGQMGTLIKYF